MIPHRPQHVGAMINRYRRAARTAAELALGEWGPLDRAVPETSTTCDGGRVTKGWLPLPVQMGKLARNRAIDLDRQRHESRWLR